jgi:hypothetical protein
MDPMIRPETNPLKSEPVGWNSDGFQGLQQSPQIKEQMPTIQTVAKTRNKINPPVRPKRLRRSRQSEGFHKFLIQCRALSTRHLRRESRELHNLQLEIAACLGAISSELDRRKTELAQTNGGKS